MEDFPNEIIYQLEKDDFEHPFYIKIMLSVYTTIIVVLAFLINRRLFIFLRRPNRRLLDFIVDIQYSVGFVLVIITLVFFNVIIWTKVPKSYVSEVGCYLGTYFFYFLAPYANCHSFFISLFRYICIIHPDKLSMRAISPEVSCVKIKIAHGQKLKVN